MAEASSAIRGYEPSRLRALPDLGGAFAKPGGELFAVNERELAVRHAPLGEVAPDHDHSLNPAAGALAVEQPRPLEDSVPEATVAVDLVVIVELRADEEA